MLISFLVILGLLAIIIFSADILVDAAESIAIRFSVPKFIISFFIIGLGTSLPEITVSSLSALEGQPLLALGNAVGSNSANIGAVLAICFLLFPHNVLLRFKEFTLLILSTLAFLWASLDTEIVAHEAYALMLLFVVCSVYLIITASDSESEEPRTESEKENKSNYLAFLILKTLASMAGLILGSKYLVEHSTRLAQGLGVPNTVIGVTVLAVGTSLPELASSLSAARKGHFKMVLGNIIGSNLFNILVAVGVAGSIQTIKIEPDFWSFDIVIMTGLTALMLLLKLPILGAVSARVFGLPLLLLYCYYIVNIVS